MCWCLLSCVHYTKSGGQSTGLQGDFLKINKIVLVHNLLVQKYLRFWPLGAFGPHVKRKNEKLFPKGERRGLLSPRLYGLCSCDPRLEVLTFKPNNVQVIVSLVKLN